MHIHDAVGQNNHLPLGTGEIDLDNRLLLAIKNNCRCVIEVKTVQGLQESVDWLRDSDYK
jgi:sugar phosphate isomerase/epimerase